MADFKVYGIRLEAGAELLDTVRDAFQRLSIPFCDVVGFGELKWVELHAENQGEGRIFKGPLHLIDFKGRLRQAGDVMLEEYVCTVSRLTDNGVQLLGGKLKEAEIEYVELTFVPVDTVDVPIQAAEKGVSKESKVADSGREAPSPSVRATINARPIAKSELPDRWAKAVLESKRVQQEADFMDDGAADVRPTRGDFVRHQQFGECKVTRISDDHVTLRKPDGRHVQLGLPILKFTREGEQEGKKVYRVEVRAKR